MTPEQQLRSRLLKTRNIRRLERSDAEKAFETAGLNGIAVSDDRAERLLDLLKSAAPVDGLVPTTEWQATVTAFGKDRFGLTVARLWDWDGLSPMFRVAAASLRERPDCLAQLFPSGFWLADDEDRHVLVVDLDFDEDAQTTNASLREIELSNAQNR